MTTFDDAPPCVKCGDVPLNPYDYTHVHGMCGDCAADEITRLRSIADPLEALLVDGNQIGLCQDVLTGLWYVYDWEHPEDDAAQGTATLPDALAAAMKATDKETRLSELSTKLNAVKRKARKGANDGDNTLSD